MHAVLTCLLAEHVAKNCYVLNFFGIPSNTSSSQKVNIECNTFEKIHRPTFVVCDLVQSFVCYVDTEKRVDKL